MKLPARIAKAPKRSSRWRSQAHLSFVRSHNCSVPGCAGRPIEAAHVRIGSGAGLGQKPSDWRAVSLCRDCHSLQHRGERTFWDNFADDNFGVTVEELIDAFCKASPRAAEIRKVREGGDG